MCLIYTHDFLHTRLVHFLFLEKASGILWGAEIKENKFNILTECNPDCNGPELHCKEMTSHSMTEETNQKQQLLLRNTLELSKTSQPLFPIRIAFW